MSERSRRGASSHACCDISNGALSDSDCDAIAPRGVATAAKDAKKSPKEILAGGGRWTHKIKDSNCAGGKDTHTERQRERDA